MRCLRQDLRLTAHGRSVGDGLWPVKLHHPAANLFRRERLRRRTVRSGPCGRYVDKRQQRGELIGRRVLGCIQKGQQPLREEQRIIGRHEDKLIPTRYHEPPS